jgi:chemotaxis signal transduction protein
VDSVSQVIRLSSSIIEKIPEEVTTVDENYIKGVMLDIA